MNKLREAIQESLSEYYREEETDAVANIIDAVIGELDQHINENHYADDETYYALRQVKKILKEAKS